MPTRILLTGVGQAGGGAGPASPSASPGDSPSPISPSASPPGSPSPSPGGPSPSPSVPDSPSPSPQGPQDCPTDCTGYPAYLMDIANVDAELCQAGKVGDCSDFNVIGAVLTRNGCSWSGGNVSITCSNTEYVPWGWPAQSWGACGLTGEQDKCGIYFYLLNTDGYPDGDYTWSAGNCGDAGSTLSVYET